MPCSFYLLFVIVIVQSNAEPIDVSNQISNNDITLLVREVTHLKKTMSQYEMKQNKLEAEVRSYKAQNEELLVRLTDVEKTQNIDHESFVRTEITKRQQAETSAFYVYLSDKRCLQSHEAFVFDTEVDIGNAYNVNDGIYDVPATGTYVFTITVTPDYFNFVQAEIMVNGVAKGSAFADSDEIHDVHPASTTIVVNANAGDHVFVRRGDWGDCNVISSPKHSRTSFAGWRLL